LKVGCKEAYRYICDNLDANIESANCRAIKKHLEGCPTCRATLDSLKKTIILYRTEASPKLPARVRKQLMKTMDLAWRDSGGKQRRGNATARK
jgi:predicted anti-sigma-YlaC factor YlaD